MSFLLRKTISYASVTLEITQTEGPPTAPNTSTDATFTHIDIQQIGTAGMKGTREVRCLDDNLRPHSDWIFGNVEGRSRWIALDEVEEEFLRGNWLEEKSGAGPDGKDHIQSFVENVDTHWTAQQIWGFQMVDGERRYARNIVIRKGDKKVEMRLVYDYLGPLA